MEYPSPWIGSGVNGGDAIAVNARRPSAGAEPARKREPGGGTQNQPFGDGSSRSASVCDAEFCGATLGQRKSHTAGCGLQTREREHGASVGERGVAEYRAVCARLAATTIASKRDRRPDATSWAESSCRCGGELRSAIRDNIRIRLY